MSNEFADKYPGVSMFLDDVKRREEAAAKKAHKCCVEGCTEVPVYNVMDGGVPVSACAEHSSFVSMRSVDDVYTLCWSHCNEVSDDNHRIVIIHFTEGKGAIVADVTKDYNWLVQNKGVIGGEYVKEKN